MYSSCKNYCRLASAYVRMNLNGQLEYRTAFYSQALAMFINNGFWLLFWFLFFSRFPVLRGWGLQDVLALWAVTAAGFGLANAVMGNGWHLAGLIANGQLDMWLLQPRAVLPHLLLGGTVATAWGDAAFGYVVYLFLVRPDLERLLMFVLLSIVVAALFVGFGVITASLGFYIGHAGTVSEQWRMVMLTFCTYPPTLFDGFARVLLFTVIPAAFVSYLPVEALRSLSWWHAAGAVMGAGLVVAVATGVFYRGLRRYESGNLMEMRG